MNLFDFARAEAERQGIPLDWIQAAQKSPVRRLLPPSAFFSDATVSCNSAMRSPCKRDVTACRARPMAISNRPGSMGLVT